jgi:AraC-like DNA-binding protein
MHISCWEIKPSAALQPYVDCYWMLSFNGKSTDLSPTQSCLPFGMVEIIVQLDNNACDVFVDGNWLPLPKVFLAGMYQETVLWRAGGSTRKFGIRLKPEAFHLLFNMPAAIAFSNYTSLHNVIGSAANYFSEQLAEAKEMSELIAIAEAFLLRQLNMQGGEHNYTIEAARLIRSTKGNISIDDVCKAVYVSPRQLQRSFRHTLGTGPKSYMRIIRFRNAFVQMQYLQKHGGWAGLSYNLGYSDQAHLIRDFKEFTGTVPSSLQMYKEHLYGRYALA